MNKPLTPEQRDWLIEQFKPFLFTSNVLNPYRAEDIFNEAKKIINQCTEKEFPKFKLQNEDEDGWIQVTLSCAGDESSEPVINIKNYISYINLFASEFKQFTAGCNKIVEWLEHNE